MIYEFENMKTGELVEVNYPMGEAPEAGTEVMIDGVMLRRIVSKAQVSAAVATVTHGYPYVSHSLPRKLKGEKTNRKGKPIVTSRRHENELKAKHGMTRD